MPDQALHTLLDLTLDKNAPVLILYTEQLSPRLRYVCEFIFNHALKVNIELTADINAWKNSPHFKINYSKSALPEGLQVMPHGLLFEKSISEQKPAAVFKNDVLYFYETLSPESGAFHFDVFSAVFYFISRYE